MKAYFLWLAKVMTVVILFFVVVPMFLAAIAAVSKGTVSEAGLPDKQVAVIELTGMIEGSKEIVDELYKQAANKAVKGIVLRINSPGGAVGPSQDIYTAVSKIKLRKPVVASMGSVAASGGLYSALSASKIFCQPGTLTGSIGVILQIPNFTKVTEKIGVDFVTIKSGKLKDVGNAFREMTEEERAFLQGTVDVVEKDFVQAVVDGRGIPREEVLKFADGRMILGSQAMELKLVDKIGTVYDAAREVFEILGEPLPADEAPQLYYPEDKFGRLKKLLEGALDLPLRLGRGAFYGAPEIKYLMW